MADVGTLGISQNYELYFICPNKILSTNLCPITYYNDLHLNYLVLTSFIFYYYMLLISLFNEYTKI